MKKFFQVIVFLFLFVFVGSFFGYGQDVKIDDFEIIPKDKIENDLNDSIDVYNRIIGNAEDYVGDNVIERYRNEAKDLSDSCDLGTAFATGVFNRKLILCYFKYLIKFLSQVGIVIGAVMIIYAGYLYASAVFAGSNPQKGATAVKNAILGVVIITFSYAILKILTSMFL